LLARHTARVVLVFDGDKAGIQAALRGTDVLAGSGLSARVASLEGAGKDPDDVLRGPGPAEMAKRLESAHEVFEFRLAHALAGLPAGDPVARVRVAREFLEWFKRLTSPMEQSVYVQKLSERLGLSEESVRSELKLARPAGSFPRNQRRFSRRGTVPSTPPAETGPAEGSFRPALTRLEEEVLAWQAQGGPSAVFDSLESGDFRSPLARAQFEALRGAVPAPEGAESEAFRARILLMEKAFPDAASAALELKRAGDRLRDERRLSELRTALSASSEEGESGALLTEIQELARKLKSPQRIHQETA